MKEIIFVLGLPGAGKTKLCKNLEKYGFIHLSLGRLLRDNIKYKSIIYDHIQRGELIPSYITSEVLEQELFKVNGSVLVDGFPRSLDNLDFWNKNVNKKPLCVLLLKCSKEISAIRICERFKEEKRIDDTQDNIRKRFESFDDLTLPVIKYFQQIGLLHEIDSSVNEIEVVNRVNNILNILKDSNINYDGTLLKFKKLSVHGKCPQKVSKYDAGFDLFSSEEKVILPWKNALIKTDISIELPFGTYGRIAPRSGLALTNLIDVGGGVIDFGYRGNIQILLFNHNQEPFIVSIGDRIAQLIVIKISTPKVIEVFELSKSERGERGFGSSGFNG